MRTGRCHGVELIADDDKVLDHQAREGKPFEAEAVRVWMSAIRRNGLALDVGAYTGIYGILAARVGAAVLAVEPNREAAERLDMNAALNGCAVPVLTVAASDATGPARLAGTRRLSSAAHLAEGDGSPVLKARLDDLIEGGLSVVKLDVEGHEVEALRGMERLIRESLPVLIVETHRPEEVRAALPVPYRLRPLDSRNWYGEPA